MTLSADDKIEIQELAARYALTMDENDLTGWMDTWAEEGVWQGPRGTYAGHVELKNLLSDLGDRIKNKRHVITNPIVQGTQTLATLTCYMLIMEAKTCGAIVGSAIYRDELRKVDGRWKFTRRTIKIDS